MQSLGIPMASSDHFEILRDLIGIRLPNLVNARLQADAIREHLRTILAGIELPETTSLVVFGSLARREWTQDSDVDWTLLVNGPSDPEHFRLAVLIGDRI